MNKPVIAFSLAVLAAGCATYIDDEEARQRDARVETRLAQALEGRVAGPPQMCVRLFNLGGNESFGEGAILFGARGRGTVYVNRPPAGCPEIGPGRAIRVRTPVNQLCAGDIVEVFDPINNFGLGSCGLGDFTPYRRTR